MTRPASPKRFIGNDSRVVRAFYALAAVALVLAVTGFALAWFAT